ncbi:MAG TPA: SDR family NAD(P)-dependent oxidoreductase [Thermoleophilaceae bacterium]
MPYPDDIGRLGTLDDLLTERVKHGSHPGADPPPRERPLAGAVALVTGASSGIGAATAAALAGQGAQVALVARRRYRLNAVADGIRERGGSALELEVDITDPRQAAGAVDWAVTQLGRLDVLVNNAGIMLLGPALEAPLAEWERMVALNVLGTLYVTHAALPHLVRAAEEEPRRVADLVTISSSAGRVARPGAGVYALTKFGIAAFAESLRQELVSRRVRVSVVEPGTVDTELVSHVRDEIRDAARSQVESIEPLRPEDIADTVAQIVTRDRRVAVNEVLVRAAEQTW